MHAKWLNTLSYLENCGARKIAACEHPTLVKEEMLKHASEEFRHAFHLKKQIERIPSLSLDDYSIHNLLGDYASLHYLHALDIKTCRYLSEEVKLQKNKVKETAYLLVTYAIELRADELYRIYDEVLKTANTKVTVKSILLEEKEHLNEMILGISLLENGQLYAEEVCLIEGGLCRKWLNSISSLII
ncbi:MAG: hypothetical protein H0W88_07695 [Parachlamydiaceae bacterium]|nr:hypothetical protein [Parachlamydiaceae bacterium]